MGKQLIVLLIFGQISIACSRHLFFGETWAGKSTLINTLCDANEPIADPSAGQVGSTTTLVKTILCGNTQAIDTIGVFDYHENITLRLGTVEVITTLLDNAAEHGLSSVLFVWPSLRRNANAELEDIFVTLRKLLPEIPMAIVHNKYPGYSSNVPGQYHRKFGLPLLEACREDASALRGWMNEHTQQIRVTLPNGWRDMLTKHDVEQLRSALLTSSLMACNTVKEQLAVITGRIENVPNPKENCECSENCQLCSQDCRRTRKYCCDRTFGICTSKCTESWIDENCQSAVSRCHDKCSQRITDCHSQCIRAHQEVLASTKEQLADLNAVFQDVSNSNRDILKTCDRFHIGHHSEEL